MNTTTQPDGYAIVVTTRPQYIAEQSRPEQGHYAFAYTITLENRGRRSAQLLSRHWLITNADGEIMEVKGLGVIGEQPVLVPGASYTYTSGTLLATPHGTMHGTYQMQGEDGARFEAEIPLFTLVFPGLLH